MPPTKKKARAFGRFTTVCVKRRIFLIADIFRHSSMLLVASRLTVWLWRTYVLQCVAGLAVRLTSFSLRQTNALYNNLKNVMHSGFLKLHYAFSRNKWLYYMTLKTTITFMYLTETVLHNPNTAHIICTTKGIRCKVM